MKQRTTIRGITKTAFDAARGAVHYMPDYRVPVCGTKNGNKFSDSPTGITCKRCVKRMRNP